MFLSDLVLASLHISSKLAFHTADGFDSNTSAADNFDVFEFTLHKLNNCVILGGSLNKFQQKAVFSVVDNAGFKGLGYLKKFYFICGSAV